LDVTAFFICTGTGLEPQARPLEMRLEEHRKWQIDRMSI
jgi:hypothetical protein